MGSTSPCLTLQAAELSLRLATLNLGGGQFFTLWDRVHAAPPPYSYLLNSRSRGTEYTRCSETVVPELDISLLSSPLRSPYQKPGQSPFAIVKFSSRRYHGSQANPQCSPQTVDGGSGFQVPASRYRFHMLPRQCRHSSARQCQVFSALVTRNRRRITVRVSPCLCCQLPNSAGLIGV